MPNVSTVSTDGRTDDFLSKTYFLIVPTQPLPILTPAERKTRYEIAGELFRLTRPTFNERLGLALPGFYIKRTVQYLDFLFLLDSSSSVGSRNFEKAKDASKVKIIRISLSLSFKIEQDLGPVVPN